MRINDQTSRFYIYNNIYYIYIYIASFDFDDLTVAALAVLAPPINSCMLSWTLKPFQFALP